MATYRIVCTEQEPASQPPQHAHIVAVGIGNDPTKADKRLTLKEVIELMNQGNDFYTEGIESHRKAKVDKYQCIHCHREHIKSASDAVKDNNLDSLRSCNGWKS